MSFLLFSLAIHSEGLHSHMFSSFALQSVRKGSSVSGYVCYLKTNIYRHISRDEYHPLYQSVKDYLYGLSDYTDWEVKVQRGLLKTPKAFDICLDKME